jgi:hypothetical protein
VQGDHVVGGLAQVRVWLVGQGRGQGSLALGLCHDGHNIRALAALADAHHQRVAKARRPLIDRKEAGRGQADRQAVCRAEQVLGVTRRVVAGAASGDQDVVDLAALDLGGQGGHGLALVVEQAAQDGGLLVDFLVQTGSSQIDHFVSTPTCYSSSPIQ